MLLIIIKINESIKDINNDWLRLHFLIASHRTTLRFSVLSNKDFRKGFPKIWTKNRIDNRIESRIQIAKPRNERNNRMIAKALIAASAQGEQNLHNKKRQPAQDKARHDNSERLSRLALALHINFSLLHAAQIKQFGTLHIRRRRLRNFGTFESTIGRVFKLQLDSRSGNLSNATLCLLGIICLCGLHATIAAIDTRELISRAYGSKLNRLTDHIDYEFLTFRLVLRFIFGFFSLEIAQCETFARLS